MTIVSLATLSRAQINALAELTLEAAAQHAPGWLPTLESAREEVDETREAGKHARVLLEQDSPLGWVCASKAWGRIWELHPLMVGVAHQRRGIGRLLVRDIEAIAREHDALTMLLGTSDLTDATSLSSIDLYTDTTAWFGRVRALKPHPFEFWQRVGYTIVGVIPDAEAPGKPSIQLARRLCTI
ncbi:MAG TPA: GNAT family N-acetyltransferase [Kofleriaceae bacterium]|jgi:aminoglycoside 6'-N-acetyltransferase I